MGIPKIYANINCIWHYAPEEPDRRGLFWTVTKYGDIGTKMYTPEGGWNTFEKCGVIKPNPNRDEWAQDYIAAWTYDTPFTAVMTEEENLET